MKKVLIITTISGFLPQFEMNDVKILQEYGYEVHYASNFNNPVYNCDKKSLKEQGIKLHQVDIMKSPAAISGNIRAFRQIRKIIDKEHIQMVHCHNPMGAAVARYAARFSKTKPYVIYTAHGFHFYKGAPLKNWLFYYTAEKLLAHYTDMLITINKEDFDRAKRKFKLKKNGCVKHIHGVGVDVERFKSRPEDKSALRKELGIPEKAFHIVTAAELNDNKNQKVIIEAIAKLGRDDIFYTICGKGENEQKLKELIRELNLENRVRLLGFRTDMENILQTADCFAFPSIREGLGIAAVEALATGVPLIVADNRGTREYTVNGLNGLVCGADQVDSFVKAIEKLYLDIKYRMKLSGHCRSMAEQFSIGAVEHTMQEIYAEADARLIVAAKTDKTGKTESDSLRKQVKNTDLAGVEKQQVRS